MTALASAPGATLQRTTGPTDAQMRASFDKIVPPDKTIGNPADAGAAADSNKSASQVLAEAAGADKAPEAGDKPGPMPSDELVKIRATLNLHGIDNETIDHLAEWNPEKLRGLAGKAKERSRETDKKLREAAEARKSEQRDDRPAEKAAPQVDFDALGDVIESDLTTEGRTAFKAFRKGLLDKLSTLERQQSQGNGLANYATEQLERIEKDQWRQANRERFPQLADDEHWNELEEHAKRQVRIGGYRSISEVLSDSARIKFSDAMHQETVRQSKDVARKREAGQVEPPNSPRSPQTQKLSPEQISRRIYDGIKDGKINAAMSHEQRMKTLGITAR